MKFEHGLATAENCYGITLNCAYKSENNMFVTTMYNDCDIDWVEVPEKPADTQTTITPEYSPIQ